MNDEDVLKPVIWIGTSQKDIRSFPEAVRRDIGQALYAAQKGMTDPAAKPLKGFGGHSVMEIVAPFDGNTWRGVYTVRFKGVIYVLHVSRKKSKSAIETRKPTIEMTQQQ